MMEGGEGGQGGGREGAFKVYVFSTNSQSGYLKSLFNFFGQSMYLPL